MITRRSTLVGLALLGLSPLAEVGANSASARIRVVRTPGWQNKCVHCIPGELYGVADAIPVKLCDTVELSFENNTVEKSAIPPGSYHATVRTDHTKTWMSDDLKAWRLELLDTSPRRAIQFHYGRDVKWSSGCIILGLNLPEMCGKDACAFTDSPLGAVKALREYVMSRTVKSDDVIEVEII